MKVLLSGSSGLIGSALARSLKRSGHEVGRLVRSSAATSPDVRSWDPAAGRLDADQLADADAVVHLGGESLAAGRWTTARKTRILHSRVDSTRLLSETLAGLSSGPQVFLCASAVGYYGDRGDELLDETSPPGTNWLSKVCTAWEAATGPAAQSGVRVVCLRLGPVLAAKGGMLPEVVRPMRFGLGGRWGSGRQWLSWIGLGDVSAAIEHLLLADALGGPVNLTAPQPVTNREFVKTLGRVLRRPTLVAMPAWALRLALGQMADEMLLAGARVVPRRLEESGFRFAHAELEPALREILGR